MNNDYGHIDDGIPLDDLYGPDTAGDRYVRRAHENHDRISEELAASGIIRLDSDPMYTYSTKAGQIGWRRCRAASFGEAAILMDCPKKNVKKVIGCGQESYGERRDRRDD